jgi:hypothetical protein
VTCPCLPSWKAEKQKFNPEDSSVGPLQNPIKLLIVTDETCSIHYTAVVSKEGGILLYLMTYQNGLKNLTNFRGYLIGLWNIEKEDGAKSLFFSKITGPSHFWEEEHKMIADELSRFQN